MAGGAGLCVIMRTPAGKTYLFDTANGDAHGKSEKNNGRDLILPWLEKRGIDRIDGLIISHYHADHFGGFLWLGDHFPIERVFDNSYMPPENECSKHDTQEYQAARQALDRWERKHPGRLVTNLREGTDLGWDEDGVKFEVVWPPRGEYVKPLGDRKGFAKGDGIFHHLLNANSTALQVTVGKRRFFIIGDIQSDYQHAFMRPYLERQGRWGCDVVVIGAHGTRPEHSVVDVLAMSPKPKIAISSIGDLPWMFETGKATMKTYSANFETYVTNIHGTIEIVSKPAGATCIRQCSWRPRVR